jgi:hypothetical protein
MPKSENEMPGEELGMITRNIDKYEQSLNETTRKISNLRKDSFNALTTQLINEYSDYDADGNTEASNYLEIEKKINLLEGEKQDIESKRQVCVSRLQTKMLGNLLSIENSELLPQENVSLPDGVSQQIADKPYAVVDNNAESSYERRTCSTRSSSREIETQEHEKASTHNEELRYDKEEKRNSQHKIGFSWF